MLEPDMKLQQLRYVLEITRHGNHLSAAAEALNTSQPGVSRQIQLLENELGFEIFLRTRNRIIGLTPPGKHVVDIAQRVVDDVGALRSLRDQVSIGDRGTLTIGTTHTQARYVLPRVIASFVKAYPDVELVLKEGDPEEVCKMVDAGTADLAIGTETSGTFPHLVKLPCFEITRSVVAKTGHPILRVDKLTLQEIAAYPIIVYGARHSGRFKVMSAFSKAGIEPKISLSAIDADICKTYVELGLGIAILADITIDPARDTKLRARSAKDLFESSVCFVTMRPASYLRPYVIDFLKTISPRLTATVVREAIRVSRKQNNMQS
jgi:LysR family transcriptional regulator, cys regulon transcriptional activator